MTQYCLLLLTIFNVELTMFWFWEILTVNVVCMMTLTTSIQPLSNPRALTRPDIVPHIISCWRRPVLSVHAHAGPLKSST